MEISKKTDLPVGKSKDFEYKGDPALLLNTEGNIRAYINICTHEYCQTDFDGKKEIHCPCHGSVYDANTGDVLNPPAMEPLTKIDIKVTDDSIETTENGGS